MAARTIRSRRIDVLLCNRHVQSRIKGAEFIWDASVPVHAVQLVKVQGGPPPKHRVWKAGRQYGEEVLPKKEHPGLASNLRAPGGTGMKPATRVSMLCGASLSWLRMSSTA